MKKFRIPVLILSIIFIGYSSLFYGQANDELSKKALEICHKYFMIDTHCDVTSKLEKGFDFSKRHLSGHIDLPRMRQGGLDAEFFVVFTSPSIIGCDAVPEALRMFEAIHETVDRYPGKLSFALCPEDIKKNFKDHRVSILIGMENGSPILEGRMDLLHLYWRLGARYVGLCHWNTNFLCDSATDKPKWHGLSPWGRKVIVEMNRLGIIVDVSHLSDESVKDILRVSKAPIMASHSSCRALCNHPRNLPDELIRSIARKGGLIDINFYPGFISPKYIKVNKKRQKKFAPQLKSLKKRFPHDTEAYYTEVAKLYAKHPIALPNVEVLVKHIEHAVKVAGIDHVGFGSDFDGITALPSDINGCEDMSKIVYCLLKDGFNEKEVRKIMGENFLHFFERVERVSLKFHSVPSGN